MIARPSEVRGLWTIGDVLRWTEDYFRRLGIATGRLDAELLLAHALGATRLDLYTGYQKVLEPPELAAFRALIERRAKREPVAYITGKREFYSLAFEVTPAVLIPRPETEHLVEAALQELKRIGAAGEAAAVPAPARRGAPRVLDLGTGSGNIAIALAVNAPRAVVEAVESSPAALDVARRNAERHAVTGRVTFLLGDLFAALAPATARYDVIVSNPPYISRRDYDGLMDDVRLHEPEAALRDGRSEAGDGLGYYRTFAAEAARHLEPSGLLGVEVGQGQAGPVTEIFLGRGWRLESIVKDYGGIERVVTVRS